MKKLSVLLGLFALLVAELVFANATVTSATGTVSVAVGTAPGRTLRLGDIVRQGETVSAGPGSSVVMRFDDGQIVALPANSRITVTTYQYNAQTQSGNVLLSLIDGGMRAITGLIGRRSPDNVAYRAATATIGIRGTDITLVTSAGNLVVTVADGVISFRVGTGPIQTVSAGNAASLVNGQVATGPAASIIGALPRELGVRATDVQNAISLLNAAIQNAITTQATTGQQAASSSISVATTPTGSGSSGGGGTSGTGSP